MVYNEIIEEQLRHGFIEKVPELELAKVCHYVPHHVVHKESTTTSVSTVGLCLSMHAPWNLNVFTTLDFPDLRVKHNTHVFVQFL